MADRRIVEEESWNDRPTRSRGPVIGLIIVLAVALVILVLFLFSDDADDDGGGVNVEDIEVDIGDEGG